MVFPPDDIKFDLPAQNSNYYSIFKKFPHLLTWGKACYNTPIPKGGLENAGY
jgi:hypothetical protein